MENTYKADDLQSITGLEWVRKRPESSIRDTSTRGQHTLVREVFENAIDEADQTNAENSLVQVYMFLDRTNHTYTMVVRDHGRGIPHEALVRSCTEMFNSAKYSGNTYKNTAGLNGMGLKSVSGLSSRFRIITSREGKASSYYLQNGDINTGKLELNACDVGDDHGTLVAYEPDTSIFSEVDEFIEQGPYQLQRTYYLISMFSKKVCIVFNVIEENIDPSFWKMSTKRALGYIDRNYLHKFNTLVNGVDEGTAMQYLRELWQLSPSDNFQWELTDIEYLSDTLDFNISVYLPRALRGTNATTVVNNVPIQDNDSTHISVLVQELKKRLSEFIENNDHKEYFLNIYKLPVCIAMSVKYVDARFTGLAKSGFKSTKFEQEFRGVLDGVLQTTIADWKKLYTCIAKDIVNKYNIYYNKPQTKLGKISLQFVKPQFIDCKRIGTPEAELFIVEGTSASHITSVRNPDTQAILMLFGKPKNSLKVGVNQTPYSAFQSDDLLKLLENILNIHPKQTDLSTANFGKIILMNDADIDGGHIQCLHISNLYNLNPLIITSGMLYIANPPLYELDISSAKGIAATNVENRVYQYIQDKPALIDFLVECLYKNALDIFIRDGIVYKDPVKLKGEAYTDFCFIITELGEIFANLSKSLAIPSLVLEKITHLTGYIQPGKVDGKLLTEELGMYSSYDPRTDILTVSEGKNDYSCPLTDICNVLYSEILGYLHKLGWKHLEIYVSTKLTDTLKNTRVSITQLYEIFTTISSTLDITRQKGLGGIDPQNLKPICIDPETRILHQITSLGDYERIKMLMGSDVTLRKEILRLHGLELNNGM